MPHFDYCCEVWDSVASVLAKRCARVIMRYKSEAGQSELALRHLGWSLLSERRIHRDRDLAPARLSNIFRDYC